MRRLLAVVPLVLLAGCANASSISVAADPTTAVTAPATASDPRAGCAPLPTPTGNEGAAVDYVDFVRAHGVTYLADADATTVIRAADAGALQFRVRCSLGALNTATHQQPPPARDGDAAYLPSGTPVYAEKNWSPTCRLLVNGDGGWRAYNATTSTGTPIPCTASPGASQSTVPSNHGSYGDCHTEALPSGQTAGEPDFAEFLVYGGQTFLSGIPQGTDSDRGDLVFKVSCDFGAFSDSLSGTNQGAVQANGDAAFLAAGTPVYAVNGSSPRCKLMAKESDGWHTYTANGPGCATPAPVATALPTHG